MLHQFANVQGAQRVLRDPAVRPMCITCPSRVQKCMKKEVNFSRLCMQAAAVTVREGISISSLCALEEPCSFCPERNKGFYARFSTVLVQPGGCDHDRVALGHRLGGCVRLQRWLRSCFKSRWPPSLSLCCRFAPRKQFSWPRAALFLKESMMVAREDLGRQRVRANTA